MSDVTFIRCIEPSAVRPDFLDGPAFDGVQLYLVLGRARGVSVNSDGRAVLNGEFEAMVLGRPGRFQSRQCMLFDCEASQMLHTHVARWPQGYELAAVCMGYRSVDGSDPFARYILRHLHMIGDPTSG